MVEMSAETAVLLDDCPQIGYQVKVTGPDEYRLDGNDNDGRGCAHPGRLFPLPGACRATGGARRRARGAGRDQRVLITPANTPELS